MKHTGELRRGSAKTVRFEITQMRLREHPEHPLSTVVVRHGKREALIRHARRQKDRHRPTFPFYSLLAGWQRLFAPGADVK